MAKSEMKGQIPDNAKLERVTLEILGASNPYEITRRTVRRILENKLGLFCSRACRLSDGLCTSGSQFVRAFVAS